MELKEYQEQAMSTKMESCDNPLYMLFEISSEAGELHGKFAKAIRKGAIEFVGNNDPIDIFYPTGCWNPTFKASYNDIASKLQFALKKIIWMLDGTEYRQNFIIKEDSKGLHFETW